jgi:hypothetical protein
MSTSAGPLAASRTALCRIAAHELTPTFYANTRKALHYSQAFRFSQAIKDLSPHPCGCGDANLIAA